MLKYHPHPPVGWERIVNHPANPLVSWLRLQYTRRSGETSILVPPSSTYRTASNPTHDITDPPTNHRPPILPPLPVVSDSQHHHSFSSIFKWYLFREKPRENQHHLRRATGTGDTAAAETGGDR